MQVSVARYLRTPPYAARRKGLVSATRTAYAARAIAGARLSFATVRFEPITVVSHRDKANPFRRSSILFRPHDPQMTGYGGAAGYRPRVRSAYYERVYVHSPRRNMVNIRFVRGDLKGGIGINNSKIAMNVVEAPTPGAAPWRVLQRHPQRACGSRVQGHSVRCWPLLRCGLGWHPQYLCATR